MHAHGPLRAITERDWLLPLVVRLTARHEAQQATPWAVSDAPAGYIDKLLAAIVGIEIPLTRLAGKWKLGQNRTAEDQSRMADGLAASHMRGAAQALGALMTSEMTQAR